MRRHARRRSGQRALAESQARGADLPRSLHPVIDADRCIGSLACIRSCPEGDILGLVGSAAALVHAEHCVGHGRCAAECPVQAIQLVFGTSRRGVDLPEVSEQFESSRPGVHVVGELGGMGLVRNAMRQGLECAEYLAASLGGGPRGDGAVDVVVVGAGPAGLATALGLRDAGLGYRLLEQGVLGGAAAHYPRQKVVMTERVELPRVGRFGKSRMTKDELLEAFRRLVARGGLAVEEGVKVTGVLPPGDDAPGGALTVLTEAGERILARKVVLAVGRRGTPRRLEVPGEELTKVVYALEDPEPYRGGRVLVVDGGDAALEAAAALAGAGVETTLSYRGERLARCRAENRGRIEALAAEGRLRLLLGSEVIAIEPQEVLLRTSAAGTGDALRLPNDHVVVSIGGEPPTELLARCGVQLRRYFGEALGAPRPDDASSHARSLEVVLRRERAERRRERRRALALAAVGLAVLALLAWKGRDYYPLEGLARRRSPLHRELRPAGAWGHGVGIAAAAFLLSNFLYAARKRLAPLRRLGQLRGWLGVHVFVGFMSPLVIAFHAAFQSRNQLATWTAGALAVVVGTGLVGRYVYGLVPASGRAEELEDLQARLVRLRDEIGPLLARTRDPGRVKRLFARAASPVRRGPLVATLVAWPFRRLAARLSLLRVRALFQDAASYAGFRDTLLRVDRLRLQIGSYGSLKRFLGGWRALHASLALFLVALMAVHIGVALWLGYGLVRVR